MRREFVSFPSRGETCHAYLYRPAEQSGDVPCVVMAHGFSGTRDDALPAFAERFAEAGFAVLVFDYRHFGASTGEPRQLLDIGRQLDDYRAAIAYARGLPGIDGRIALWGSSFSGGHVIQLAAERDDLSAVIAQVPFVDGIAAARQMPLRNMLLATLLALVDQALALIPGNKRPAVRMPVVGPPGSFAAMTQPEADPGFKRMLALYGDRSRWRNEVAARVMLRIPLYRPVRYADRITCPLLVCVADADQTTPPGPAVRVAAKAPLGELRRYSFGHFDGYVGEDFNKLVADQVLFLRRHLAAARTAATAGRSE
jgi:dienelactone hydrolase